MELKIWSVVVALAILSLSLVLAVLGPATGAALVTLITAAVGAVTGTTVSAAERKLEVTVVKPLAEHVLILGIFIIVFVSGLLEVLTGDQALEIGALLVTYTLSRSLK